MNWYDRTRRQLKRRGITQNTLAERLGVTPSCLSQWLSGNREPPIGQLTAIIRFLGVDAGWLLYGAAHREYIDIDDAITVAQGFTDKARTRERGEVTT